MVAFTNIAKLDSSCDNSKGRDRAERRFAPHSSPWGNGLSPNSSTNNGSTTGGDYKPAAIRNPSNASTSTSMVKGLSGRRVVIVGSGGSDRNAKIETEGCRDTSTIILLDPYGTGDPKPIPYDLAAPFPYETPDKTLAGISTPREA